MLCWRRPRSEPIFSFVCFHRLMKSQWEKTGLRSPVCSVCKTKWSYCRFELDTQGLSGLFTKPTASRAHVSQCRTVEQQPCLLVLMRFSHFPGRDGDNLCGLFWDAPGWVWLPPSNDCSTLCQSQRHLPQWCLCRSWTCWSQVHC